MKPLSKILLLITIVISFFISGCYTVLWTPEEELPNESNYQPEPGYYIDDYYYYYDYPWWLTVNHPVRNENSNSNYERDKNNNISTLRNTGDGRGTQGTRGDILTPPPVSKDNNSNGNSSSGNQSTEVRKNTNSGTTSNSSNAGRQSSGNNSNSTRNSNGGRNNGGGR